MNSESIGAACVSFFVIFGGSLLIGAFFGILCTWTFKGAPPSPPEAPPYPPPAKALR